MDFPETGAARRGPPQTSAGWDGRSGERPCSFRQRPWGGASPIREAMRLATRGRSTARSSSSAAPVEWSGRAGGSVVASDWKRFWAKVVGAPARALARRLSAQLPGRSYDGILLAVWERQLVPRA